jgi:hypothetical protein
MKNLFLAFALVITTLTFAQKKERNVEDQLSTAQKTELLLKKMTLELDLTEKQQKDLKPILLEQANERAQKMAEFKAKKENGEKMSKEQKFAHANNKLDAQIAFKNKLKKVLTADQLAKIDDMKSSRREKSKKRRNKIEGRKKQ